MKYIMLSTEFTGVTKLVPIIFPDFLVHSMVADAIKPLISGSVVVSAGDIQMGVYNCSGASETLGVESKESDLGVIDTYDYLHGIGFSGE